MRLNKRGFTLIEIIVVVVILAVLMAVAVPSVLKYINTADEAPALTECHAIVTASQKRVLDNYSKTREDVYSLSSDDIKWIEDFVNEGGTIQGNITVKQNEVTRLIYLSSNGLYVLYDKNKNPEYSIISKEEANNDRVIQLNSLLAEYTARTKELAEKQVANGINNLDRNVLIQELINNGGLKQVDEEIQTAVNSKMPLYWRPYYVGAKENPQLFLYANTDNNNNTKWDCQVIYINGAFYQTKKGVSSFYTYDQSNALEELEKYISTSSEYTLLDLKINDLD